MSKINFVTTDIDNEFEKPSYKRRYRWVQSQPNGRDIVEGDKQRANHGRDKDFGFPIGNYTQSSPMLFTRDGHTLWLGDMYRGKHAFLVCNGPSFTELLDGYSRKHDMKNKKMLEYPGFVTMSINNGIKLFRTDLWVGTDAPSKFLYSLWQDPKIMKFVPRENQESTLFDSHTWKPKDIRVADCPNVVFFNRNRYLNTDQFLYESSFNWGNTSRHGGNRTTMLVAIKMLYFLGCRRVYLLGADFNMSAENPYSFDETKGVSGISHNNKKYKALNDSFKELRPHFEENDFYVYNCNQYSKLKAFDFKSFDDAWEDATNDIPDLNLEKTRGLYRK